MDIILKNNYGYRWNKEKDIYFKGYLINEENGNVLRGEAAIDLLSAASTYEELVELLNSIDGSFAFVIKRSNKTWIGVDVARSMPMFFSSEFGIISDSVKEIVRKCNITEDKLNPSAVDEFIKTYYIGHDRTFYKNISQLDAGQVTEISDGITRTEYYYVHNFRTIEISREEALRKYTEVSERVFADVINIANGRPIVVSLSGGYDSRYVACMLKKTGAENVSCYSYGKGMSFEVKKSKQIAEELGYRWTFVDYTDEKMKENFTGEYIDFFDVYEGMDSVPYIQNYIAVKHLEEQGWFEKDSVFVTGLCNDMQTGAYTKNEEALKDFKPNNAYLCEHIIRRRNLNNCLGEKSLNEYRINLNKIIERMGLNVNSYQEFVSASEAIEAILIHSRVFLHMNDAHALFGYEWILPCWNKKNLQFWYSLPYVYRVNQNLYEEWQMKCVPKEYGVSEKKTRISYTLYTGVDKMKARIRLVVKRLLFFPLGLNMNEETDYNNFNFVSAKYFQKISEKSVIGFKNTSINNVLALYSAEQWLGDNIYKGLIKKYEEE